MYNIEIVLANQNGVNLPENNVNLLFLRNVFHHLPEPIDYFKNIKKFLKNDGKVAIIDYKKKEFNFTGLFGHYTPEDVLIDTMDKAGFSILKNLIFS
ncbi:MAG: methyltransferase domain-containing protein [Methanobacteriaceae archaeon]|nr:methyltransferase domain-containing protein [Methanobacteriaceae archaeon]